MKQFLLNPKQGHVKPWADDSRERQPMARVAELVDAIEICVIKGDIESLYKTLTGSNPVSRTIIG